MINPKQCKCNPMINRQMEANKKKSNDFLIIKNKTEHVLEESKHAKTKISKQQKADKHKPFPTLSPLLFHCHSSPLFCNMLLLITHSHHQHFLTVIWNYITLPLMF